MTTESIKARIAKLLAKAEKTTNEFEAAAFMAKVNELLEQHQIEIWEVRDAADVDPMGVTLGEAGIYASMAWGKHLLFKVAKFYHCEAVVYGYGAKSRRIYKLAGRESCRMTTELMLPFIISQIRQAARKMTKSYADDGLEMTVSKAERYIADALIDRIAGLIHARTTANPQANDFGGRAMVLIDEATAYVAEHMNAKPSKSRKLTTTAEAMELAGKISLNHQATGTKTKLLA
jgi:hypothetical protein